ncbi:hypothetical protein GCM10028803_38820 [Larkinella knui]|uniref:Uncharacterized protein n=1 Tax=Larkinella knui TaxID=2025310 RepID=A0A3P1CEQ8_9BACT|nr:hypothetical protein [Larkinella knui]RRB11727.1 hypothetical protein EHT87_24995 [Larkinella knui]
MKTSSQNVFYALIATVLFSACSRPYATYQKMPVEHFSSQKVKTAPVEAPTVVSTQDVAVTTPQPQPLAAAPQLADIDKVQQAVDQAVASSTNKVAANKLQRRMAHVRSLLSSEASQSTTASEKAKVAKKPNLAERLMLKNVDKKIKRALAPNHPNAPKAVNVFVTVGAIVALVGLIIALATTSNAIGFTLLVVGLVLLLVGLIV